MQHTKKVFRQPLASCWLPRPPQTATASRQVHLCTHLGFVGVRVQPALKHVVRLEGEMAVCEVGECLCKGSFAIRGRVGARSARMQPSAAAEVRLLYVACARPPRPRDWSSRGAPGAHAAAARRPEAHIRAGVTPGAVPVEPRVGAHLGAVCMGPQRPPAHLLAGVDAGARHPAVRRAPAARHDLVGRGAGMRRALRGVEDGGALPCAAAQPCQQAMRAQARQAGSRLAKCRRITGTSLASGHRQRNRAQGMRPSERMGHAAAAVRGQDI